MQTLSLKPPNFNVVLTTLLHVMINIYHLLYFIAVFIVLTDFGVDHLEDFKEKTSCPWLISNVKDNLTDEPLAEGRISHIVEWQNKKVLLFMT